MKGMKKILAVSGGVDSMVLFDMMWKKYPREELVVAHFDHGMRSSAGADYDFVEKMCEERGVEFVGGRGELGAETGEAGARRARYEFLRKVADKYGGGIWTAHHLDDLVGSVVINLLRGTGWRGLSVLGAEGVVRPFLDREIFEGAPFGKRDLLIYAGKQGLKFRQDPTNAEDLYLRNRLQERVSEFEGKNELFGLWEEQKRLRREIEGVVAEILEGRDWRERAWWRELEEEVAMELLAERLRREGVSLARPQLRDFLEAIRNYGAGKYFNLPRGRLVKMTKRAFVL